jgi:hypothetical protein
MSIDAIRVLIVQLRVLSPRQEDMDRQARDITDQFLHEADNGLDETGRAKYICHKLVGGIFVRVMQYAREPKAYLAITPGLWQLGRVVRKNTSMPADE